MMKRRFLVLAAALGTMAAATIAQASGGDFYDVTTVFVGEDGYGGGGTD
ncbi:MAG: hypothetical protein HOL13_08005, partial [Phycisphaerae bacterium]|nr:hypothetical protein [Phycisphaerae bacterium]